MWCVRVCGMGVKCVVCEGMRGVVCEGMVVCEGVWV